MQNIRWIAFGINNAVTRTAVHFYPSAGNVTAPYPVSCKVTLFAEGLESSSIAVDGLRLSQPEGIWIDEAFPALKSGNITTFGLEFVLSCNQHRVELDGSSCVVELFSVAQSVRYWPRCFNEGTSMTQLSAPLIKDAFSLSSAIFINCSEQIVEPNVLFSQAGSNQGRLLPASAESKLPAHSARELSFEAVMQDSFGSLSARECSWGVLRARSMTVQPEANNQLVAYALYRDALSRRLVSVCRL